MSGRQRTTRRPRRAAARERAPGLAPHPSLFRRWPPGAFITVGPRLAAVFGISEEALLHLLRGWAIETRSRSGRIKVRYDDMVSRLQPEAIRAAQREARSRGFAVHAASKWTVAGFPRLVAEFHPDKNGDLTPWMLSRGSVRKIWWKCPKGPDHEWKAQVLNRVNGTGCPFCARKRVSVLDSLATVAPDVARQWHPTRNGALTAHDVSAASMMLAWWSCDKGPDHQWRGQVRARVLDGVRCAFCRNDLVSVTNSLSALHPRLAAQWHPTRNGMLTPDQIVPGSNRWVWWRCERGHDWETQPMSRIRTRGLCPTCRLDERAARRARARTGDRSARR